MPYQDTKLQVADSDVKDHATFPKRRTNRDGYQLVAVGIDWGEKFHHCVVMGMRANGSYDMMNVFKVNAVSATNAMGSGSDIMSIKLKLMNYDPDIIIADVGDSGEKIHALMEIYGQDKVYGAKYSSNPTSGLYSASSKFETTWSEATSLATMDKLTQNKRFIDLMKRGMIGFWEKDDEELETYIRHWKNVFIRDDEQDDGSFRQVIGRRGGDHYAQASTICLEALDHIRQEVYSDDSYDFSYTDLDSRMKPDSPDIVKRLKESGNIYG